MKLFSELKRRNVFRVGAAYAVVSWLLVEISDTVFPRLQLPDWSVTLVIVLLLIGFPVALFFAWAFELTPEGLKREAAVDRSHSITPITGRRLDFVIIGLLLMAVGFFSFDKFMLDPARDAELEREQAERVAAALEGARSAVARENDAIQPEDHSIAVLPFVNMSPDADNAYFSDGISEELLNLLSRIPELRVISRSSSFSFKGQNVEIPEIAERLNVKHVLEGSVRRAGERVRITAQLIDATTDSHIWSESYDRTLADIFAIQDEIAAAVVAKLKVTLLGEVPRVSKTDPEAYQHFIQARQLGRLSSAEALARSNELYRRALEIDPDYAGAWRGLAANIMNQTDSGLLSFDEGPEQARNALNKALRIDPHHSEAHSLLGALAVNENDLARAARHFERALALAPNDVPVLNNSAILLERVGRSEQAITVLEAAVARAPIEPVIHANLAQNYAHARRWDDAIESWQIALQLSPEYAGIRYGVGAVLLAKGELESAREVFELEPTEACRVNGLALLALESGAEVEFETLRSQFSDRWGDGFPELAAQLYAGAGDLDTAFEWLDRAADQDQAGWGFLNSSFEPLHDDPRWQAFLERSGNTPEQLDAIEFEVPPTYR